MYTSALTAPCIGNLCICIKAKPQFVASGHNIEDIELSNHLSIKAWPKGDRFRQVSL